MIMLYRQSRLSFEKSGCIFSMMKSGPEKTEPDSVTEKDSFTRIDPT